MQSFSFNFRVFASKSGERCRNYNTFYTIFICFSAVLTQSQLESFTVKAGQNIFCVSPADFQTTEHGGSSISVLIYSTIFVHHMLVVSKISSRSPGQERVLFFNFSAIGFAAKHKLHSLRQSADSQHHLKHHYERTGAM